MDKKLIFAGSREIKTNLLINLLGLIDEYKHNILFSLNCLAYIRMFEKGYKQYISILGKILLLTKLSLVIMVLFLVNLLQLNSGKVIAVGPGSRSNDGKIIPVSLKEGDTVLLPEYGGSEIKLQDKT